MPLFLALLPAACRRAQPIVMLAPQQRLTQLRMSQSQDRETLWNLDARSAAIDDASDQAMLADPQMAFYKAGKLSSRLSAHSGMIAIKSSDITLSSDVVVTSLLDNSVLKTSELLYSSQRRKFHTDKDVLLARPGSVSRGRGLEASPDLSDITIFNQRSVVQSGKNSLQ